MRVINVVTDNEKNARAISGLPLWFWKDKILLHKWDHKLSIFSLSVGQMLQKRWNP